MKDKKIVYYKLDPVYLNTVNYKCFLETKQGKYDATTFSWQCVWLIYELNCIYLWFPAGYGRMFLKDTTNSIGLKITPDLLLSIMT